MYELIIIYVMIMIAIIIKIIRIRLFRIIIYLGRIINIIKVFHTTKQFYGSNNSDIAYITKLLVPNCNNMVT